MENETNLPPLDIKDEDHAKYDAEWESRWDGYPLDAVCAQLYCRERQLFSALAELTSLREQLAKVKIWANCGGVETPYTCTYDAENPHKIYGSGFSNGDGTHICETHQIRKAEAELSALQDRVGRAVEKVKELNVYGQLDHRNKRAALSLLKGDK